MRLYKHMCRLQFRRYFPKGSWSERKLLWGASLKPGDVISICNGFNARIATVTPERAHVISRYRDIFAQQYPGVDPKYRGSSLTGIEPIRSRRQGWYLSDFLVIDEHGGAHHTCHCCGPKETLEQLEARWRRHLLVDYPARPDDPEYLCRRRAAIERGLPLWDADGVMLPEFAYQPPSSPLPSSAVA